jgi:hypothetical protein
MFFRAEPWDFTVCYVAFGLVGLAAFFVAPARFKAVAKPPVDVEAPNA